MKKSLLLGTLATILIVGGGCARTNAPVGDTAVKPTSAPVVDTSPIKIGWMGPLTGDIASLGKNAQMATQIAIDEINAAGGINGRNLVLVAEDSKCDAKEAASAGNKLINVDKVSVIIGGLCSGETMAVAPTAEQNHVLVLSYGSSAPTVTAAGDYIFRTYPSDSFQGKFASDYVYNKLGKHKVAVLAVLGDYGTGVKNAFIDNFKKLGGEVVYAEDYAQDARDLRTQLTKVKSSGADLFYFVGYTEASVVGLKQAKELGLSLSILGADAWDDTKLHAAQGAEGIQYTAVALRTGDDWAAKLKAYAVDNTVGAPQAYDGLKIIADIMKRVGTDTSKIKDELYKVKDYAGVNGPITFDKNGDVTVANYDIKVVKNGKAEISK